MLNITDEDRYPESANEPKVHPLIRKSFAFVPSVGMRLAPEILVLEFFREVFFPNHYESVGEKDLDPEELTEDKRHFYKDGERAVLYSMRGRRRKLRNTKTKPFFAPAYPSLARKAWLRKKSERVIVNLLLGGAIAQALWGGGETVGKKREQETFAEELLLALVGHNSYRKQDLHGKDILSVALKEASFEIDEERAKENILAKTRKTENVMKIQHDELSERIFKDLQALCSLEKILPRMQWLQVFMTFLRFSMPMWLLAHMRITSLLHDYLLAVLDQGVYIDSSLIVREIAGRNRGLLTPSLTPTLEIFEKTGQYMKKRVELNILLYFLERSFNEEKRGFFANKQLVIQGAGANILTVEELLQVARENLRDKKESDSFQWEGFEGSFQNFLTRKAEQHAAWRNPLQKGQGKNIDEFFRVLYRDDLGDEVGGYLLIPEKSRERSRGFRLFPGQLLLKTIVFLSDQDKKNNNPNGGKGLLVLEDVEKHFQQYGIDFGFAADARPLLIRELQALGLLTGSPDAGSSVAVASPY